MYISATPLKYIRIGDLLNLKGDWIVDGDKGILIRYEE